MAASVYKENLWTDATETNLGHSDFPSVTIVNLTDLMSIKLHLYTILYLYSSLQIYSGLQSPGIAFNDS